MDIQQTAEFVDDSKVMTRINNEEDVARLRDFLLLYMNGLPRKTCAGMT